MKMGTVMHAMDQGKTSKKSLLINNNNNNNNNNLFIYSALFNMLCDQKRITTINNLKTINTNIRNNQHI